MNRVPIVCNLNALDAEQRRRREQLFETLRGRTDRIEETAAGFRLLFPSGGERWMAAAELLELERRCCPFLCVGLSLGENGGLTMQLGGGEGVKKFLAGELELPSSAGTRPPRRRALALLVGPIAAAAASLFCCVGPLLLAAAGIASAGAGVAFSSYRVPVAVVAVGFIATGFLVLYRPFTRGSKDRARVALPRPARALFWTGSAVALAGVLVSLFF